MEKDAAIGLDVQLDWSSIQCSEVATLRLGGRLGRDPIFSPSLRADFQPYATCTSSFAGKGGKKSLREASFVVVSDRDMKGLDGRLLV